MKAIKHQDGTASISVAPTEAANSAKLVTEVSHQSNNNSNVAIGGQPAPTGCAGGTLKLTHVDFWKNPVTVEQTNFQHKSLSVFIVNPAVGCAHGCRFCSVPEVSTIKQSRTLKEFGVEDPDAESGQYRVVCMAKIQPQTENISIPTMSGFTTAPLAAPGDLTAHNEREFERLPKSGQRDAIFSLSRSTWNLLILPCKANNFRPPIKSISLRKPGAVRGVRLISVASARAYFQGLVAQADAAEMPTGKEPAHHDTKQPRRKTRSAPPRE